MVHRNECRRRRTGRVLDLRASAHTQHVSPSHDPSIPAMVRIRIHTAHTCTPFPPSVGVTCFDLCVVDVYLTLLTWQCVFIFLRVMFVPVDSKMLFAPNALGTVLT